MSNVNSIFKGRTIQVVRDLSVDEQIYLYEKTRRLKEHIINGTDAREFRVQDSDIGVYLFFMEDSTRTKESFRNAAKFHGMKLNDFDAKNSSFQKKESITDTIKMLVGYSSQSLFIVRSKVEGLCRWLEYSLGIYADKMGMPQPAFINAGDGRHEHPTQEFLDEYSFLEQYNWDRSYINLALVGDLFHGRTVHSKVEGLRIFKEVEVDLVAPQEMTMPDHYTKKMKEYGYKVRTFESIDEYLAQKKIAPVWYFTRLQLERMGEKILNKADSLRASVTFRKDHLDLLPEGTKFYHPLPRHSETPTIPTFLDKLPVNAWDDQSRNGYLTRIIEIAMTMGHLGHDFQGETRVLPKYESEFVIPAQISSRQKKEPKVGIKPVESGIVIDHIGRNLSTKEIWDMINNIRRLLELDVYSSHGVFESHRNGGNKGIISLPGVFDLDVKEMKMLSAISPGCSLNFIKNSKVEKKFRLEMPPRVYKLKGLRCKNSDCISRPEYHEPIFADFYHSGGDVFTCKYCETPHRFSEIWYSSDF